MFQGMHNQIFWKWNQQQWGEESFCQWKLFLSHLLVAVYANVSTFLLRESKFVYNSIKIARHWFFSDIAVLIIILSYKNECKQINKPPPEYQGNMPVSSLLLSCMVNYSSAPVPRLILVYKTSQYILQCYFHFSKALWYFHH